MATEDSKISLSPFPPAPNDLIVLAVRNERFQILTSTLMANSTYFRQLFSGPMVSQLVEPARTTDGAYVVQADPNVFKYLHEFIETNTFPFLWTKSEGFDAFMYARIFQAANYYQINDLAKWIEASVYLKIVKTQSHVQSTTWLANKDVGEHTSFHGGHTIDVKIVDASEDQWICPYNHSDSELCAALKCWGNLTTRVPLRKHSMKIVTTSQKTTFDWKLLRR